MGTGCEEWQPACLFIFFTPVTNSAQELQPLKPKRQHTERPTSSVHYNCQPRAHKNDLRRYESSREAGRNKMQRVCDKQWQMVRRQAKQASGFSGVTDGIKFFEANYDSQMSERNEKTSIHLPDKGSMFRVLLINLPSTANLDSIQRV